MFGDARARVGLGGDDAAGTGLKQNVVEGEGLFAWA